MTTGRQDFSGRSTKLLQSFRCAIFAPSPTSKGMMRMFTKLNSWVRLKLTIFETAFHQTFNLLPEHRYL